MSIKEVIKKDNIKRIVILPLYESKQHYKSCNTRMIFENKDGTAHEVKLFKLYIQDTLIMVREMNLEDLTVYEGDHDKYTDDESIKYIKCILEKYDIKIDNVLNRFYNLDQEEKFIPNTPKPPNIISEMKGQVVYEGDLFELPNIVLITLLLIALVSSVYYFLY